MELTSTEEKVLKLFSERMNLVHIDQIKLIFGWRLFITDVKKIVIMYGISLMLDCLLETLLIHASFYFFRQVAYGVHSKNFLTCLFVSCLVFPFSAILLKDLQLGALHIWITFSFAIIPLLLFAPIGSAVNAIRGTAHAQYLRKKIYIRLCIFVLLLLFLPISIAKFLVAGLFIEAITILLSIIQKGE